MWVSGIHPEFRCPEFTTLVTSQLRVDTWHDYLVEPTLADAILD